MILTRGVLSGWLWFRNVRAISCTFCIPQVVVFEWNMFKASRNLPHWFMLVFFLENRRETLLFWSPSTFFIYCLGTCVEPRLTKERQIPKTRNPRPRLVPWMVICVIIPALGHQSSRTGVIQALFVEMPSVVEKASRMKFVLLGLSYSPSAHQL